MSFRQRAQMKLLRRALRIEIRSRNEYCESLIRLALDDEAVFATLYDSSMHRVKRFATSTQAFAVTANKDGAPIVDNLLKLFQWFVTNGPLLIEIIEQIVGLFGSVAKATEICEAETMFVE
jgi:hypothetical protein